MRIVRVIDRIGNTGIPFEFQFDGQVHIVNGPFVTDRDGKTHYSAHLAYDAAIHGRIRSILPGTLNVQTGQYDCRLAIEGEDDLSPYLPPAEAPVELVDRSSTDLAGQAKKPLTLSNPIPREPVMAAPNVSWGSENT